MEKTAQKMPFTSKLREHLSPGKQLEEIFNPEFLEIMNQLRDEVDDPVRALLSGEKVGNADPIIEVNLKELLKSAKSNFNRREYMRCIADLSRFHKVMAEVSKKLSSFKVNVDKVHHKFLFDRFDPAHSDYDPEYAKYLKDLKETFGKHEKKAELLQIDYNLIKQAGISDFLSNVLTDRGRALRVWEKRYPRMVNKLKSETKRLLDKSESLLRMTLEQMKQLAKDRASRKVDDYIEHSKKIIREFANYNNMFKSYYDTYVKEFLSKQEEIKEEIKETPVQKTVETPIIQESPKTIEKRREELGKAIQTELNKPVEQQKTLPVTIPAKEKVVETPKKQIPSMLQDPELRALMEEPEPKKTGEETEEEKLTRIKQEKEEEKKEIEERNKREQERRKQIAQKAQLPKPTETSVHPLSGLELKKSSYNDFIKTLESLATESPIILKSYIKKYATMIENEDKQTAKKLLEIIKSIQV
jgi:ribosomal protein S20